MKPALPHSRLSSAPTVTETILAEPRLRDRPEVHLRRICGRMISLNGLVIVVYRILMSGITRVTVAFMMTALWLPLVIKIYAPDSGAAHVRDGTVFDNFVTNVECTATVGVLIAGLYYIPKWYADSRWKYRRQNRRKFALLMRDRLDPYANDRTWNYYSDEDPVSSAATFRDLDRRPENQMWASYVAYALYTKPTPMQPITSPDAIVTYELADGYDSDDIEAGDAEVHRIHRGF